MQVTIKPEQLQSVVQQMLHDIPQKCDNAIDKAEATVSKKAVKELKATSPKGNGPQGGRYAKGWGVKKTKETTIIYNKTDGQLTPVYVEMDENEFPYFILCGDTWIHILQK